MNPQAQGSAPPEPAQLPVAEQHGQRPADANSMMSQEMAARRQGLLQSGPRASGLDQVSGAGAEPPARGL
eukprot:12896010-Prorocentrum_lima.AAC.1